jgi:hypothetical protein
MKSIASVGHFYMAKQSIVVCFCNVMLKSWSSRLGRFYSFCPLTAPRAVCLNFILVWLL